MRAAAGPEDARRGRARGARSIWRTFVMPAAVTGWASLVSAACMAEAAALSPPAPPAAAADGVRRTAASPTLTDQYGDVAGRIIDATMARNDAWRKMEQLCDGIGHRLSGSPELERAVEWAATAMIRDGLENVRKEPVTVPHWVRGRESLVMTQPRRMELTMLGLGGSIATPAEGVTAPVLVVEDKDELDRLGDAARGRIVLFNHAMPPYHEETGTHYGTTVQYRGNGAAWAAEKGAVAALVRSVTARSLNSPHTGAMRYRDGVPKIPTAAVSIEHAEMISRLSRSGVSVTVTLKMEAHMRPDAESANVIGELRGRTKPEEIVVIGGHLDSWDVGQGAHDDAGGCVISMEAVNVLRRLDLRPARTIRVVLFTNEENGLAGGTAYAEKHLPDMPNHVAAIESDGGVFAPVGFSVTTASDARQARAQEQLGQITALLERIGATRASDGGGGADIGPMRKHGVTLLAHNVDMSTYFDIHHSPADTLDKVIPEDLSRNVAAMAVVAYVLADMPGRLGDSAGEAGSQSVNE